MRFGLDRSKNGEEFERTPGAVAVNEKRQEAALADKIARACLCSACRFLWVCYGKVPFEDRSPCTRFSPLFLPFFCDKLR